MDNETQQRVDVLWVMRRDAGDAHEHRCGKYKAEHTIKMERESAEARAAVAKLIEATNGLIEFVEPILTAHGFGYVGRIEKARKALAKVGAQS